MSDRDALLAAIVAEPHDPFLWLVLADWLDDHGESEPAEVLRLHRRLIETCCEPEAHPERAAWQSRMVELLVAGVEPCLPRMSLELPGGEPMSFAWIPPGSFLMGGDCRNNTTPVHKVTITQGFWMGTTAVTQAQWMAVMGGEPKGNFDDAQWIGMINGELKRGFAFPGDERRPAEQVAWNACVRFCKKLAARSGRSIRLPTEAEWEYACRAGTTTEFWSGDGEEALQSVGWYSGNSGGTTHPVGELAANPWGLHDVHGNVYDWSLDDELAYTKDDQSDPGLEQGMRMFESIDSTSHHVLRGGTYMSEHNDCIAVSRVKFEAFLRCRNIGFRVCFRPNE